MSEIRQGSCLCGAVSFRTSGTLRAVVGCHCSQCRKQTGFYFAATDVDLDRLDVEGEANIRWYRSSDTARRGFCGTCGSALFWQGDGRGTISILAGAFDASSGLAFGYHIFCADKGDFYSLSDDLPKFPGGAPADDATVAPVCSSAQ